MQITAGSAHCTEETYIRQVRVKNETVFAKNRLNLELSFNLHA